MLGLRPVLQHVPLQSHDQVVAASLFLPMGCMSCNGHLAVIRDDSASDVLLGGGMECLALSL